MNPISISTELPRAPRYDSLDFWRGVACLAVVIFHVAGSDRMIQAPPAIAAVCAKMWLGVQLFFVISGYCIAATCDSARRKERSFGWFMRRRMRRIFPPYWVCISIIAVAARFGLAGHDISNPFLLTVGQWIGNLTLTEAWREKLFDGDRRFVLSPAWTLCYEEQFYLICGVLLVLRRQAFFAGVAAVTVFSIPLTLLNWSGTANLLGFFFDGYWLQFAAGVLVYHGRNYAGSWGLRPYIALLLGAAAGVAALRLALPLSIIHGQSRAAFLDGTALAFAFGAALLQFERWDSSIARTSVFRPIQICGIMCYSLYLIHQVVIVGMRIAMTRLGIDSGGSTVGAVAAVATVLCSIAGGGCFYWLVERHFLNVPTMSTTRSLKLDG